MQKIIEYEDKVALYHNSNIPDINKVNDDDMNEIKSVVNGSLQGTNAMGSIVVDDVNGKNIYDGNFEIGGYNQTTGEKSTSSTQYRNANPIPCKPNTTYTFSINGTKYTSNIRYFFYGANLNYLSSEASGTGNITTPSDCYYVSYHSTSLKTDYPDGLSKAQIEKGSTATEYTEYKQPVKKTSIGVKESCTFYANDFKCKNMFYKSNVVAGYLSNAGNVVSNTQYSTSNYINVRGISNITISGSSGNNENICFYDSSQTFISFISTGANATLTTSVPSNAYYCRITVKNTNLDLVQLEVGSEATPYTEYKNFENEEIYSTNEMVIGKWIDGKPLYRRVYTFTTPSSANTATEILDITDLKMNYLIKNICNIKAAYNFTDNSNTQNLVTFIRTSGSNVKYVINIINSSYTSCGAILILEYTKTTD